MPGLSKQDVQYLKYKPKLGLKKEILSRVSIDTSYTPSACVDRMLDKTPSGILGKIADALDMSQMLQSRIEKCLEDFSVGGTSFDKYVKELKNSNGDKELVRSFEKSNALALNGTSQAEVYPLLNEMDKELISLQNSINKVFYDGSANMSDLALLEDKDAAKLDALVEKDMSGSISGCKKSVLDTQNVLLEVADRKIQNCENLMKQCSDLLCSTVNTYYNGNIDDIVSKYGEADISILENINEINAISFRKSAATSEQDLARNRQLNSPSTKERMNDLFITISSIKDKSSSTLDWALSIDTDFDQNAYAQIVSDAFDQVEFAREEFEKATLEVFKQTKLDEIVRNDIVTSLQAKRFERQKYALISDILEQKKSGTFNAESFVNDKKLRNKGTLCSR